MGYVSSLKGTITNITNTFSGALLKPPNLIPWGQRSSVLKEFLSFRCVKSLAKTLPVFVVQANQLISQMVHVWIFSYIWLQNYGKCRKIFHTWSICVWFLEKSFIVSTLQGTNISHQTGKGTSSTQKYLLVPQEGIQNFLSVSMSH